MTASLIILSGKADPNTWESFTRSELKLFSFQIKSNCHFIWKSRTESKLLKSCVKTEMIWGAVTSAGVDPLRFIKSKVNAAVYQEIWELYASISWQALLRCGFLFQQDFSTCPHSQNYFQEVCWLWYYSAWLASQHTLLEPDMEYVQVKDKKQSIQQHRRAECSIVPQQSYRLIASMPLLTDAGVCAKGAPTKYWVHKLTWTSVLQIIFLIELRK